MIIQCESCVSKYFLPEAKIPPTPLKVSCPKCRAVFRLMPPSEKVFAGQRETVLPSGVNATGAEPAHAAAPAAAKSSSRAKRSDARGPDARARRLARVLVSDILCYNKEKRDQALIDGELMSVLGDEIKKSWELYKEKVGPDLANSTDYFKEALNEILADGQKIF
jgi:predicted Zn finger-like uncharacterized protein